MIVYSSTVNHLLLVGLLMLSPLREAEVASGQEDQSGNNEDDFMLVSEPDVPAAEGQSMVQEGESNLDVLKEFYIYTPADDEMAPNEPDTANLPPAERLPAMMSSWWPGSELLLPRGKGLHPIGGVGEQKADKKEEEEGEVGNMTPRSSGGSGTSDVSGLAQEDLVRGIGGSEFGQKPSGDKNNETTSSGDPLEGQEFGSNQLNNQIGAYGIETEEQRALRAKIVKNWKQQRTQNKTSAANSSSVSTPPDPTASTTTTTTSSSTTTTTTTTTSTITQAPDGKSGSSGGGATNGEKWEPQPYCIGSEQPSDKTNQFHWICQGLKLRKVPEALDPKPVSLRITGTGIEVLKSDALAAYRDTLKDFSIENAPRLLAIEPHAFAPLRALRVVYIMAAPKLKSFDLALSGLHPQLSVLRIHKTGLRWWPDLSHFKQEEIFTSVELDGNDIEILGEKPINLRAGWLNLEFNNIREIGEFAFNGSEIGTLTLAGNKQLTYIHENAFAHLKNLVKLDLSGTSIESLPQAGLQSLVSLIMKDTFTLQRIPSIYSFPSLSEAQLTYAYHCCAFRHPETHDPKAHEEHLRMQEQINAVCASKLNGQLAESEAKQHQSPSSEPPVGATVESAGGNEFEGFFGDVQQVPQVPPMGQFARPPRGRPLGEAPAVTRSSARSTTNFVTSRQLEQDEETEVNYAATDANFDGFVGPAFENLKGRANISYTIECGELVKQTIQNVTCSPVPDAYSPCEDIMGNMVLRISVWFVVAACILGNMAVLLVQIVIGRRISVPKFLQLNLAFGDMMMGVYLLMLALADLATLGSYFNYANEWQQGLGCKVTGAAGLFASQLSIFTLMIITFERYYTITYSIDLNMRLHLGWAARIMVFGWFFALGSAILPALGKVNSYSKTSICLPLRTHSLWDGIFVSVLLSIDFFAFVVIFACYLRMYLLVMRQQTDATSQERRVAKRMALLVCTDFACWAPIIFFGASALMGYPLISVSHSKILIVFFYPLNSMANPYLYVLSTRQYRRDLELFRQKIAIWRNSFFKKNDDSYYSANFYAGINHSAAINAHLGAVAAVTGVAHHLHLHEQQVDCIKGNKGGHYIIRHQILTGRERDIRSKRQTHLFDEPAHATIPLNNYHHHRQYKSSETLPKSLDPLAMAKDPEACSGFYGIGGSLDEDSRRPLACVSESGESCTEPTSGSCCPESANRVQDLNEPPGRLSSASSLRRRYRDAATGSASPPNGRCCKCCTRLCSRSRQSRASRRRNNPAATTCSTRVVVSGENLIATNMTSNGTQTNELPSTLSESTDNPAPGAKNLCRLALRESTESKSVALVSPMRRLSAVQVNAPIKFPRISSSTDEPPEISSSTEHGGRYGALVDDIFKETYRNDSRRANERRKSSVDILGNLSLTNEPTTSTSGCHEQPLPTVRVIEVCKSTSKHHSHHDHHKRRHRRHHHHHRHHHDESRESTNRSDATNDRSRHGHGHHRHSRHRHRCTASQPLPQQHQHNHLHQHHHVHLAAPPRVISESLDDRNESKENGEELNDPAQAQPLPIMSSAQQSPLESILKSSKTQVSPELSSNNFEASKKNSSGLQRVGLLLHWRRSMSEETNSRRATGSSMRICREKKRVSILEHYSG